MVDVSYVLVSFFTLLHVFILFFFFFNDTATTEIYTLSLHDALPISAAPAPWRGLAEVLKRADIFFHGRRISTTGKNVEQRSEEHTSELQSRLHLVCRLLLEKKKKNPQPQTPSITTNPLQLRQDPNCI